MKKLYTLICTGLFFTFTASAQVTYTAVVPGNWTSSGPGIWVTGPPPPTCDNCVIQLNAAGVIHLNTHITLTGGSTLIIGSGTTLKIDASTATSFTAAGNTSNYIDLDGDANNQIQWLANSALDARGLDQPAAGGYDGVFNGVAGGPGVRFRLKEFGAAPLQFRNDEIRDVNKSVQGVFMGGPATLSSVGALPIVLSSFTASLDKDVVNLAWTTALEENASHIAIQRSSDAGGHWETIGSIPAKNNTHTATDYTFTDGRPAAGTNEYRLQLVDLDGKYSYSEVRTIRTGLLGAASVFPNPAHDYINVALNGSATETMMIRLFNQSGQMLQQRSVNNAGGSTIALSVSNYPMGNYLVVITAADGSKQVTNVLISK